MKRSGLKRPTLEQVIAWETRQRAKRRARPLAPVGRRARRAQVAWTACRAAVQSRSRGRCEGAVANVCPPWPHAAVHVHHCWPEDRDAGAHEPGRCLHLCAAVHAWAHANPTLAAEAGILRPVVDTPPRDGVL